MHHPHSLSVVPIFVNAGAALLPALIAALTSLIALLLSPRALLSLCRRKPWLPALVITMGVLAWYSPRLFPNTQAHTATTAPSSAIDWPAIARDRLRQQQGTHSLLTPLWHHDLDNQIPLSTPALFTEPATGKTVLYLPTTLFDTGKKFGSLFAIDAATGQTLWTATTDNTTDLKPFFSSPALSPNGSLLAVGQGLHDDANCALLCFGVKDATQNKPAAVQWSIKTPLHVESSPAIFTRNGRQLVVVGAGAIEGPDRKPIGNPGYVLCADLVSGKQLWQFPLYDPESSPAVDEQGAIYIGSGFNGNAVVALRSDPDDALANTPREIWRIKTPYPAVGDVTLAKSSTDPAAADIVLIGLGNGDYVFSDPKPAGLILALDSRTGTILWQTALPDSSLGRLLVTSLSSSSASDHWPLTTDHSIVLAPCRDGQAYALDLATGKILWQTTISATPNIPLLAGLAADDSHAFALAADGTLAILDLASGQLLERLKLSDDAKFPQNLSLSTPILHNHILYVATETTALHAFRVSQ
jgi:outer membrane protein assembly factor BamB